ncbi:unnamed protein product, partial [Hapterophycus canaliculatus]
MGDNEAFMDDFGDSFNEDDPYQMKTSRNTAEALDTSLQAPNANDFSNARLIEELESRNSRVSGFRDQDVVTLQKILDAEFELEKESLIKHQREKREQAAKQAGLQRKRMMLERQLREEITEIQKNHRIEFWLTLVKQNATPSTARIQVNSITARALAKAMWTNTSLTSLDLSCSGIDDAAGAYVARLLKRNNALVNVALGSNGLGVFACRAFGESLCSNSTLKCLNLESNPLTGDGENISGIRAVADMFGKNTTLTSVNLWRCALGPEAGATISRGIQSNHNINFLEVGLNRFAMLDQQTIQQTLRKNFETFQKRQAVRRHEQGIAEKILAKEKNMQEQLRSERELREWLKDQKQLRAEERRRMEEKG